MPSPSYDAAKTAIDLTLSALAVLFLSPVLIAIAILVRVRMGRPILFRQLRPGKDGVPFTIMKFRTMSGDHGPRGRSAPDDERVTEVGLMLRRTSLDELPELFNVLKGDMSLVGPRPLLMDYLERYSRESARRHEVKPGMTGLAQVRGRNALSWEEKFALDVWYVDHRSLWLDLRILVMTPWAVLTARGERPVDRTTDTDFLGGSTDEEHPTPNDGEEGNEK